VSQFLSLYVVQVVLYAVHGSCAAPGICHVCDNLSEYLEMLP